MAFHLGTNRAFTDDHEGRNESKKMASISRKSHFSACCRAYNFNYCTHKRGLKQFFIFFYNGEFENKAIFILNNFKTWNENSIRYLQWHIVGNDYSLISVIYSQIQKYRNIMCHTLTFLAKVYFINKTLFYFLSEKQISPSFSASKVTPNIWKPSFFLSNDISEIMIGQNVKTENSPGFASLTKLYWFDRIFGWRWTTNGNRENGSLRFY